MTLLPKILNYSNKSANRVNGKTNLPKSHILLKVYSLFIRWDAIFGLISIVCVQRATRDARADFRDDRNVDADDAAAQPHPDAGPLRSLPLHGRRVA